MSIFKGSFDLLKGGVGQVASGALSVKELCEGLAKSVSGKAGAVLPDVTTLFNILSKIPALPIPQEELSGAQLDASLAVIQMGSLACIISFDAQNRTDARLVHTGDVAALAKDDARHSVSSYTSGEGAEAKTLTLTINKKNWQENHQFLTADAVTAALLFPVGKVPFVGGTLSHLLAPPVTAIADFIVKLAHTQIGNAAGLVTQTASAITSKVVPPKV